MSMYRRVVVECDYEWTGAMSHEPEKCSNTVWIEARTFETALFLLEEENEWGYIKGAGKGTGVNLGKFLCFVHFVRHQMDQALDEEALQAQRYQEEDALQIQYDRGPINE